MKLPLLSRLAARRPSPRQPFAVKDKTRYEGTLVAHGLERTDDDPPTHEFEATGDDSAEFKRLASRFLGPEIGTVAGIDTQERATGSA